MKRHRNFEINSPNNYEKSMENELGGRMADSDIYYKIWYK